MRPRPHHSYPLEVPHRSVSGSVASSILSHLVQGGLGHRVVLDGQRVLMLGELSKYVGQSSLRVGELVLQRVVVLLLQDAAGERLLDEVLHWLQRSRIAAYSHDDCVAVAEPTNHNPISLWLN